MAAESPSPEDLQCKRLQRGDPGDPHMCILAGERSLKRATDSLVVNCNGATNKGVYASYIV